jgi:hypothetical protein
MKKLGSQVLLCCFLFAIPLMAQHKYIGVSQCGMCHKSEKAGKQFDIWKSSKHAQAYVTLTTDTANAIAKAKGLTKPASESPECLKCHVTGYGADAKLFEKKFDIKDGVQCEVCHGPGSDYKSVTVMKDTAKAFAAGLNISKDDPKLCEKCHNSESPSFKGFDYKEMWDKIKHPIPPKG